MSWSETVPVGKVCMNKSLEILVASGPLTGRRFVVGDSGLRLGRSSSCDIAIKSIELSRSHCIFECVDGGLSVTDLESENGTYVNGERLGREPRNLGIGDSVAVGVSHLVIVGAGEPLPTGWRPPVARSRIDLGDAARPEATESRGPWLFRALVIAVACAIVLAASAVRLLHGCPGERSGTADVGQKVDSDLRALSYEAVSASQEGICRYALAVDADGRVTVSVDDLPAARRRVRKSDRLSAEGRVRLARLLESADLPRSGRRYVGKPDREGAHRSSRLKVEQGTDAFAVSVEDAPDPDALRAVFEGLEALVEEETGVKAVRKAGDRGDMDGFRSGQEADLPAGEVSATEPETGLVLVKTTPAGAHVTLGGTSLGVTPLLLTSLPTGRTHVLDLSLDGFRVRRVPVRVEDRGPVVCDEALVSDGGTVSCASDPPGATVLLNGAVRGVTPLELPDVPKGPVSVTFRLEGHREETRDLLIGTGDRQVLSVRLQEIPARVEVVSVPPGADVQLGGKVLGRTPLTVSVPAGRHELRVDFPGGGAVSRSIDLRAGGRASETFRIEDSVGRLEIVTIPAGARVFVDGKPVGMTRDRGEDAASSLALVLGAVPVGEHAVTASLDGCPAASRTVTVKPHETGRLFIKLNRGTGTGD